MAELVRHTVPLPSREEIQVLLKMGACGYRCQHQTHALLHQSLCLLKGACHRGKSRMITRFPRDVTGPSSQLCHLLCERSTLASLVRGLWQSPWLRLPQLPSRVRVSAQAESSPCFSTLPLWRCPPPSKVAAFPQATQVAPQDLLSLPEKPALERQTNKKRALVLALA